MKKILAREILVIFGCALLLLIIWSILFFKNVYLKNKIANTNNQITVLSNTLKKIPKDNIGLIYNVFYPSFVVDYKVGNDIECVSKFEEKEFLRVNKEEQHKIPEGFVITAGETFKLRSKKKSVTFEGYSKLDDGSVVFNLVDLTKFRKLLKTKDYQIKLFSKLNEVPKWEDCIPIDSNLLSVLGQPDNIAYSNLKIETFEDFENVIQAGLLCDTTNIAKAEMIQNQIQTFNQKKNDTQLKLNKKSDDQKNLWLLAMIIGILAYPVRLSVLLIIWALKTVRSN